jgi:hypothetical protein
MLIMGLIFFASLPQTDFTCRRTLNLPEGSRVDVILKSPNRRTEKLRIPRGK